MYDEKVVLRMMAKAMIQALNASANSGSSLIVEFHIDGASQAINAVVKDSDLYGNEYGGSQLLNDRFL